MGGSTLYGFSEEPHESGETCRFGGASSPEDIFLSILGSLENVSDQFLPQQETHNNDVNLLSPREEGDGRRIRLASQRSTSSSALQDSSETELEAYSSARNKRPKLLTPTVTAGKASASLEEANANNNISEDGQPRTSHIAVERNRRKQMNQHLSVLRSLMPSFYVKRGDQASIIGRVVDYINELQQVLQSLEAKKQRRVYSELLMSPRLQVSSPRLPPSPRIPPPSPSPRLNSLPISPRTPPPSSSTTPYHHMLLLPPQQQQPPPPPGYLSPRCLPSPTAATSSSATSVNELVANSKSEVAEVEVKFWGPNVVLKTVSPRMFQGQPLKIVSALEQLSLEILHVSVSTLDDTMLISITIKIGIECQLSAEELAQRIQQTFC